nr:hypothetical protein [Akkermansiaceae bacterium]
STAADEITYTNFIRQFQTPSNVVWDASASVESEGSQPSELAINPGGGRFELWTVANKTPPVSYLLATAYVGTYVPVASVTIRSEDPYPIIRRTRADRPFFVDYSVSGLLSGATDPDASKAVNLIRHVQSYGVKGTGINIDRTQATLLSQATINTNGDQTLTYAVNSVPGADRSKVRGEERFSIFTFADNRVSGGITYNIAPTQVSSQFIQIWPVADASISGISQNQVFRFAMPAITITLNDLYPSSNTYAQAYKGNAVLGKTGTVIPGSSLVIDDSLPNDRVLVMDNYDQVFDEDGRWTIEILTETPFGIDRLAHVSFEVDRTIQVNGSFTTIE